MDRGAWRATVHGVARVGTRLSYQITTTTTTLMAESEEELKSFLMKVTEECEKAGLQLSIQVTKIMASGPNVSWQILLFTH